MKVKEFAKKYDFSLPLHLDGLGIDRELSFYECWKVKNTNSKKRYFNEYFDGADKLVWQICAAPDGITLILK